MESIRPAAMKEVSKGRDQDQADASSAATGAIESTNSNAPHHASVNTATTTTVPRRKSCFVDYIPPKPAPLPPPAKWKLWLIVLVLVYFAVWCAAASDFLAALGRSGWLSPNAARFLMLCIIVFCLTFAALDLLVMAFTWNIGGDTYGLGPFLKGPRWGCKIDRWQDRRRQNRANKDCSHGYILQALFLFGDFVVEFLACIVKILEDGFAMFNPPGTVWATSGKRRPQAPMKQYEAGSEGSDSSVTVKIHYELDPDRMEEYRAWKEKIVRMVKRMDGFESVVTETDDTTDDSQYEGERGEWDEEKGGGGIAHSSVGDDHKNPVVTEFVYVTFSSIDLLNEWMTSPRRAKLMNDLQPLLLKPNEVQIQRDRVLPDAFTDLLTRQGENCPTFLPKKWKVWWLTTIGLYFCLLWMDEVLPYYFQKWGMDGAHPRLNSLVSTLFNTFINTYIMTPLLLFFFSDWLRRKEGENDQNEPWRTLNDGIRWLWLKVVVVLAFYGGCIIAWAVKR